MGAGGARLWLKSTPCVKRLRFDDDTATALTAGDPRLAQADRVATTMSPSGARARPISAGDEHVRRAAASPGSLATNDGRCTGGDRPLLRSTSAACRRGVEARRCAVS